MQIRSRRSNYKINDQASSFFFWLKQNNGDSIYLPASSNQKFEQNICNSGFLTWDIRRHRTVIADREEINEVSNTVAQVLLGRVSRQQQGVGGCGKNMGSPWVQEAALGRSEVQAVQGHRIVYWREENCMGNFRNLQKVPFESSAECWSVLICNEII